MRATTALRRTSATTGAVASVTKARQTFGNGTAPTPPPPSGSTEAITKTYYYAGAQMVAMRELTASGDSTLYFLHSDHLGSTSLTTSSAGALVARQYYYPYGEIRPGGTGAIPTDIGFTGQRREDSGLGSLMFYNARYMSPLLGRFVSADTIVPGAGNSQALNRYSYVYNSPLNYIDPSGHDPCTGVAGTYVPDCGVDGWTGPKGNGQYDLTGYLAQAMTAPFVSI